MAKATDNQESYLVGQYFGSDFRTYNGNQYYQITVLQMSTMSMCTYSCSEGIFRKVTQDGFKLNDPIGCTIQVSTNTYDGKTRVRRTITTIEKLEEFLEHMSNLTPEDFELGK